MRFPYILFLFTVMHAVNIFSMDINILAKTMSELLLTDGSESNIKKKTFERWRSEYEEFRSSYQQNPGKDALQHFLTPYINALRKKINSAPSKDTAEPDSHQYTLIFHKIDEANHNKLIENYFETTVEIPMNSYKTVGRIGACDICSAAFPRNLSSLHLILLQSSKGLLVFDPFSLCGTEMHDHKPSIEEILQGQNSRHRSYEPFFISSDKVILRIGAGILEIIPEVKKEPEITPWQEY